MSIKWKMQELSFLFKKSDLKKLKTDYAEPGLEMKEEAQCLLEGVLIVCLFSYFFYRSYFAVVILAPGIFFYRKEKKKRKGEKRKILLEQQFRETLLSVQTNLQSGYSVENAFLESYPYIVNLYGKTSDMAVELKRIQRGLANGDTMEHLLWDLGKRCPESAVEDFANIYLIAVKTGSGWTEIIMKIIADISQKMEMKQEIETLIHGKKLESRMMCIIPFFILFYMDLTSKGYFDVLYHNIAGIVIMTICMAAYVFAFLMSEKITEL